MFAQAPEQAMRKHDKVRTIAFAVTNVDEASLAVDVAALERQDLGDAQAGPIGGRRACR